MNPALYTQLAQVEDQHWWFKYRRKLVRNYLDKLTFSKEAKALDLGCGVGGNLKLLSQYCLEVYGVEISEEAVKLGRRKHTGYQFVKGDINHLQDLFPEKHFNLVTIFNVLYHQWIKSEREVLEQVYRILKPGGTVLLTEPAFKILMRRHDVLGMGKTRYRIREFEYMMAEIGFEQVRGTYFNSISFLPALVLAWLERPKLLESENEGSRVNELKMVGPVINKFILGLLNIERLIIKLFKKMPLGVTLLCIARRSSSPKF